MLRKYVPIATFLLTYTLIAPILSPVSDFSLLEQEDISLDPVMPQDADALTAMSPMSCREMEDAPRVFRPLTTDQKASVCEERESPHDNSGGTP